MVEKTIFIVKPIYVPIQVPVSASNKNGYAQQDIGLQGKKRLKVKCKQQKAIYSEKPMPPNYRAGPPAANEVKSTTKKSKGKKSRAHPSELVSRSPSPFSQNKSHNAYENLNQSSIDPMMLQSFGAPEERLSHAVT